MFLAMMADRHKRKNRSVRLPEDLEQWLDKQAEQPGVTFNGLVVDACRLLQAARSDDVVPPAPTRKTAVRPRTVVGYSKEQQARGRKP